MDLFGFGVNPHACTKIAEEPNQDEMGATIWMRLLCRGRSDVIMLIVAGKVFIVF